MKRTRAALTTGLALFLVPGLALFAIHTGRFGTGLDPLLVRWLAIGWLLLVLLGLLGLLLTALARYGYQAGALLPAFAHQLAAGLGLSTTRAPPGYVEALFDAYAESFDQHLLQELNYQAPNLVRGLSAPCLLQGKLAVADLGCGTGVCGPLFARYCHHLVGVDLSGQMLAVAGRRGCYDELIQADLVDFLSRRPGAFDLCIAADVLVYQGDLAGVFEAVAGALVPGGWFVFTVEAGHSRPWQLRRTGRYTHAEPYLRSLALGCGLEIRALETHTLRTQAEQPVAGHAVLLRRPAAEPPQ